MNSKSVSTKGEVLKLKVITKESTCYIQLNSNSSYGKDIVKNYKFNGETPKETNKSYWYEVKYPILKVEKQGRDIYENYRYELKEGFPESELTPKIIYENSLEDTKYEEVQGLYIRRYDTVKGELENIEFELDIIAQRRNDFDFPKQPQYTVSYWLLDEIETHPDLLFEKPCSIGGKALYEIVKKYLADKVDGRYASLENGYSWRIKVDKRIKLATPYTTRYDSNSLNKKKRPNWVEKLNTDKLVNVVLFEDSNSTKIYPPTIHGNNIEDLDEKLNEYLENLVDMINEPYSECECCNGYGVVKANGEKIESKK